MPFPKTLDQAIEQAVCIGPAAEMRTRSYQILRAFIADKFADAGFKSQSKEETRRLKNLFDELTKRKEGESDY